MSSLDLLTEAEEQKKEDGGEARIVSASTRGTATSVRTTVTRRRETRNPIRFRFADWVGKGILHAYPPSLPFNHSFVHSSI
jgi:hypothetical protein